VEHAVGVHQAAGASVGFVDALFIGIGLWILDVPLVIPPGGADRSSAPSSRSSVRFVAGAFAVLVALVDEGLTVALHRLGIVLLVQQIEGNVLQPIIQGRGLQPARRGGHPRRHRRRSLFGIVGAFLGVPGGGAVAVATVRARRPGRPPPRGRRRRHRRPGRRRRRTARC
jgi:predicted PurR-regulated permease PerM